MPNCNSKLNPNPKQEIKNQKKKHIFVLYITHIDKHNPVMIATSHTHSHLYMHSYTHTYARDIAIPYVLQLAGYCRKQHPHPSFLHMCAANRESERSLILSLPLFSLEFSFCP